MPPKASFLKTEFAKVFLDNEGAQKKIFDDKHGSSSGTSVMAKMKVCVRAGVRCDKAMG